MAQNITAAINDSPATSFERAHPVQLLVPIGGRVQKIAMSAADARVLWNSLQGVLVEMDKRGEE